MKASIVTRLDRLNRRVPPVWKDLGRHRRGLDDGRRVIGRRRAKANPHAQAANRNAMRESELIKTARTETAAYDVLTLLMHRHGASFVLDVLRYWHVVASLESPRRKAGRGPQRQ